MPTFDLSDNVQLIIDLLSIKHRTIDKKTFIIQENERQYTLYLENLPEVRIERVEPLECFEWHDSIPFAKTAAYFVSDTPCLGLVLVDDTSKTVVFRKEFTLGTDRWAICAQLYQGLDDIDQSVKAFREACSVDDDLYKLRLEELLEQGLIRAAHNEAQEDYIYGTNQETND